MMSSVVPRNDASIGVDESGNGVMDAGAACQVAARAPSDPGSFGAHLAPGSTQEHRWSALGDMDILGMTIRVPTRLVNVPGVSA